jgi:hypothetical protein
MLFIDHNETEMKKKLYFSESGILTGAYFDGRCVICFKKAYFSAFVRKMLVFVANYPFLIYKKNIKI